MPYISDEELLDFQVQIDEAKEEKRITNYAHTKEIRDEQEKTRKFKISTIILGFIALLGVAGTVYFMNFNTPENMIAKKEYDSHVNSLNDKIKTLEESVQGLSMTNEIEGERNNGEVNESLEGELTYSVQIGAFEKRDLSLYSDNYVNFKEIKAGEYNKYALGNFASLNEAKMFRKELVRLGFKDAFIASYQNGERLRIEEAW
ncbi:SPOR domain-containing protein [Aquimarina sp. 2201CG5-10]|uniref:SPOR domain-containing protein n=1 Tax=Aquimarina callyspongiae TaxID=3098150 RepID=UPI002AB476DB|nr:SPOR domain-containing protein [Aquimarina sp. 2201CG5-10]MDY8136421.1 SPOR domain-containing protein [Aquimarina sp. 2201CG5-10]